jgi:class 3 adenylate cyclase
MISDTSPLILFVDDEPDVEALIRQKFRKSGYRFMFSPNGEHALEAIASQNGIDLVVSDINMPVMDGLSLLAELKSNFPLVKTIIVSAYDDMDNIRQAMNRGAFDFLTKPINFTDLELTLGKTLEYVSELKQNILSLRENNIMKMFIDDSVLSHMLSRVHGQNLDQSEYINASVAFIDICGFTSLSENADPRSVLELLQDYFDSIVHIVLQNNGCIDKFIGDAVMATFVSDGHQVSAVNACLEIRRVISQMDQYKYESFSFVPQVSIGLNSGTLLRGPVGSRRLNRYDFTVIGDCVNIASRLQSMAAPGEVLSTGLFCKNLPSNCCHELIGKTKLKGRQEHVDVARIL